MKKSITIGFFSGVFLAFLLWALPHEFRRDFLLITSVIIPTLYVGFSIQEGKPKNILIQIVGAIIFIGIGLLGAWKWPILFPLGIMLHGFWDIIHHSKHASLKVQKWYPPFCAVIDWTLGALILIFYLYN